MQDFARGGTAAQSDDAAFTALVARHSAAVKRGLVAAYGVEIGSEAAADAIAWAWEHRGRLAETANPAGYLYRVGQSAAKRHRRRRRVVLPPERPAAEVTEIDHRLDEALLSLDPRPRAVAVLVHGYGYSYAEVAELTGRSVASVRNDLHRAMKLLRHRLEPR